MANKVIRPPGLRRRSTYRGCALVIVPAIYAIVTALMIVASWCQPVTGRYLAFCSALLAFVGLCLQVILPESDAKMIDKLSTTQAACTSTTACNNCLCSLCGQPYDKHELFPDFVDHNGHPFLRKLCNGDLVKL